MAKIQGFSLKNYDAPKENFSLEKYEAPLEKFSLDDYDPPVEKFSLKDYEPPSEKTEETIRAAPTGYRHDIKREINQARMGKIPFAEPLKQAMIGFADEATLGYMLKGSEKFLGKEFVEKQEAPELDKLSRLARGAGRIPGFALGAPARLFKGGAKLTEKAISKFAPKLLSKKILPSMIKGAGAFGLYEAAKAPEKGIKEKITGVPTALGLGAATAGGGKVLKNKLVKVAIKKYLKQGNFIKAQQVLDKNVPKGIDQWLLQSEVNVARNKGIEKVVAQTSEKVLPVIKQVANFSSKLDETESNKVMDKVADVLKKAEKLLPKQAKLYTKERGARIKKGLAIEKKVIPEKGYEKAFHAKKGAFKGEMEKVKFDYIREQAGQDTVDNLFRIVQENKIISEFEKMTAGSAISKMLQGQAPARKEIELLSEIFNPKLMKSIMSMQGTWANLKRIGLEVTSIPKTLMSSFDLSFGFRQGGYLAPTYRKQWGDAFRKQFKLFGSEKAYKETMKSIVNHPNYQLARQGRLGLTQLGTSLGLREEKFMSSFAEKIPLIGRGVKASERAYTGFANKMRFDVFNSLVNDMKKTGLNPATDQRALESITRFVNAATGRGGLKNLGEAGQLLNAVFFSPRLIISRAQLLADPRIYLTAPAPVRKQAWKSAAGYWGALTTVLTLAKLGGADVGTDIRSADFGKIKIGNTRIDLGAGFFPYLRGAGQLISGEYISSTTGKKLTLGEGYKPLTRKDIALRLGESKLAPVASFVSDWLEQQEWTGEDFDVQKNIAERVTPMVIQDLYDLSLEDPKLAPLGILPIFGVGLQTYGGGERKQLRQLRPLRSIKRK